MRHLRWDFLHHVPMLNDFTVLHAEQVVERLWFSAPFAFADGQYKVTFAQYFVDFAVFEHVVCCNQLTDGFVQTIQAIFDADIVLVILRCADVVSDFLWGFAKQYIINKVFHQGFVGLGFVQIGHLRRAFDLGATAGGCVGQWVNRIPMLGDFAVGHAENIKRHDFFRAKCFGVVVGIVHDHEVAIDKDAVVLRGRARLFKQGREANHRLDACRDVRVVLDVVFRKIRVNAVDAVVFKKRVDGVDGDSYV